MLNQAESSTLPRPWKMRLNHHSSGGGLAVAGNKQTLHIERIITMGKIKEFLTKENLRSAAVKELIFAEIEEVMDKIIGPGPQVSVDQEKIENMCDRMDAALVTIFKAHESGKYDYVDQKVTAAYGEISWALEVLREMCGIESS